MARIVDMLPLALLACHSPAATDSCYKLKGSAGPCDTEAWYDCDVTEDGIVSELSPEQLRDDLEHSLEVAETMVGVWPFSCTTVAGTPVDGSLTLVAIDRSTLTQWSAVGEACDADNNVLSGAVEATFTTSLGDDWSSAILDVYAIRDDGSGAFGVAVYDVAGEQESGHVTWYPDGRIEGEAHWLKPSDSCNWSTTGAPFS